MNKRHKRKSLLTFRTRKWTNLEQLLYDSGDLYLNTLNQLKNIAE